MFSAIVRLLWEVVWKAVLIAATKAGFWAAVLVRRLASQAIIRDEKVFLLIITPLPANQLSIWGCMCFWVIRRSISSRKILRSIRGRGIVNSAQKKDLIAIIYRTRQRGHYKIDIIISRCVDRVWWRVRWAGGWFSKKKKGFWESRPSSLPGHVITTLTRSPVFHTLHQLHSFISQQRLYISLWNL